MPTQVTVTAYTFDELNDAAKDKARQWSRECLDVETWSDSVTEDAANVGIKIKSWTLERGRSIELEFEDSAFLTAQKIMKEHGESCETWEIARGILQLQAGTQAAYDAGDITEDEADERHEAETEAFTKEVGAAYLTMLEKEYEYRMSNEAIDEDIEAGAFLFTAEGKRTHVL